MALMLLLMGSYEMSTIDLHDTRLTVTIVYLLEQYK